MKETDTRTKKMSLGLVIDDESLNRLREAKLSCIRQVVEQLPGAVLLGNDIIIAGKFRGRLQLCANDTEAWYEVIWELPE